MNEFYIKLKSLTDKYSEAIDDHYKLSSGNLLVELENYEKVKEQFNREFHPFLIDSDLYLNDFIGCTKSTLEKAISIKTKDYDKLQTINYIAVILEDFKKEVNTNYVKAKKNHRSLKVSHQYYFLKALNEENISLLELNIREKVNYLKEQSFLGTQSNISTEFSKIAIAHELNFNLWNEKCYLLFEYVFDNYYNNGKDVKRKLTNIWYFLKNELQDSNYYFKMTKQDFKDYVFKNHDIRLTNFDKSEYKYDEEISILSMMKRNFEKQ